jgi:hypothetical protein
MLCVCPVLWDFTQRGMVSSYRRFVKPIGSDFQMSNFSLTAWSLKLVPIGCLETSVRNYHSTLCKIPKGRSRLKSRSSKTNWCVWRRLLSEWADCECELTVRVNWLWVWADCKSELTVSVSWLWEWADCECELTVRVRWQREWADCESELTVSVSWLWEWANCECELTESELTLEVSWLWERADSGSELTVRVCPCICG